jgi:uncharacterized membrane protein
MRNRTFIALVICIFWFSDSLISVFAAESQLDGASVSHGTRAAFIAMHLILYLVVASTIIAFVLVVALATKLIRKRIRDRRDALLRGFDVIQ